MSNKQPRRHVLRAPSIEEGLCELEENRQPEELAWWWQDHYPDVISLLNHGFPAGLRSTTQALILPDELDMAQAIIRQMMDKGPGENIGICYQTHINVHPESRLVSSEYPQASLFVFCEQEGWYRASQDDSHVFEAAA